PDHPDRALRTRQGRVRPSATRPRSEAGRPSGRVELRSDARQRDQDRRWLQDAAVRPDSFGSEGLLRGSPRRRHARGRHSRRDDRAGRDRVHRRRRRHHRRGPRRPVSHALRPAAQCRAVARARLPACRDAQPRAQRTAPGRCLTLSGTSRELPAFLSCPGASSSRRTRPGRIRLPEAQRPSAGEPAMSLAGRYAATRRLSEDLAGPLSEAAATIQSMPDASPTRWHLGHTTWFFETFLLRDHLPGYRLFDESWPFLFNSYYEAEGSRIPRPRRGMLSRPPLDGILDWRAHVDAAIQPLLSVPALAPLVELGIAHEQQHQELLLSDIKHALFQNPLGPAMWASPEPVVRPTEQAPEWYEHPGGITLIGHGGFVGGRAFAFDNEGPPHRVMLEPFALAGRLVSNGEWEQFIADGGYHTASLWLSDGWD